MLTSDGESLSSLLGSLEHSKQLRKIRDTLSSVSVTCHGSVASDLPLRALQLLGAQNITPDKYILSAHSITVFVKPALRESAVKTLHALI